jgi:hypothetical protein
MAEIIDVIVDSEQVRRIQHEEVGDHVFFEGFYKVEVFQDGSAIFIKVK